MSVASIIGGGIGLVRKQPGIVAVWALLYVLVGAIGVIAMQPFMAAMLGFQQQVAANTAAGIQTPPPFPTDMFGMMFLWELVAFLLMIVGFAAVVRATVRPGPDRFAHLRLGMDELRLLGLGVLFAVAAFVIELIAMLLLVLIGMVVGAALGKPAGFAIGGILALALIVGAIYLEVRISLAPVFTVLQRRIVIGPAWRATRGRFWMLFGVYALWTLAFVAVSILFFALFNPHLLTAYISMNQQATAAAVREQFARQAAGFSPGLLIQMVVGAIVFVGMGAAAIASMATAAIELDGTKEI